jgi:hypothetical protein
VDGADRDSSLRRAQLHRAGKDKTITRAGAR